MSNIESDINQNIEKIITKIDLQDFLQILEKYSVKINKFFEIIDFLKGESAVLSKIKPLTDTLIKDYKK